MATLTNLPTVYILKKKLICYSLRSGILSLEIHLSAVGWEMTVWEELDSSEVICWRGKKDFVLDWV